MAVTVRKGADIGQGARKGKQTPLVVHDIQIRSVDRTTKDIRTWRDAHQNAERIYSPSRTRLYDLYADVMLDGHLTGVIEKRIDSVLNKNLYFERGNKKVEDLEDLIDSAQFRAIMKIIMETPLWGISGIEFIPGAELQFVKIPRKHIKPETKIIAREQSGQTGFDYTQLPNVWVMGDADDLGLLLKCSPYALYKKNNLADWAQYIEIFGQPVRVVKYDATDDQVKMELKQVLDESGSSLALMIPKQADFELKDGKQSNGDGKLQDTFMRAVNDEMSIIILGNTETTANNRGGSNAKAEEQGRQQLIMNKSWLKYAVNLLNSPQFLAILKSYGYPVEGGKFKFEKEIDLDYLSSRIKIDKEVAGIVPVEDDYFYDTYGIPKPKNYEELKKEKERKSRLPLTPSEEEDIEEDDEDLPPPSPGNSTPTPQETKRILKWFANFFGLARA